MLDVDFSFLDRPVHGEKHGLLFFVRACVLAAQTSNAFLQKIFSVSLLQALLLYMPQMLPKLFLCVPTVYLLIYCLHVIIPQFRKVREENLFLRFLANSKPFPSRLEAEKAFNELLQQRAETQYMLAKEREWQIAQNQKALPENLPISQYVSMLKEAPYQHPLLVDITKDINNLTELPHIVLRCLPLVLEIGKHETVTPEEEGFLKQVKQAVQSDIASHELARQMEFTARLKAAGTMLDMKGFHQ